VGSDCDSTTWVLGVADLDLKLCFAWSGRPVIVALIEGKRAFLEFMLDVVACDDSAVYWGSFPFCSSLWLAEEA
jgi:hypothetical protein